MKVPTEAEMQAFKDRLEIRGSSLWWKVKPTNNADMNKPAGAINEKGYQVIRLTVAKGERLWKAHRIAYFLHYGVWPTQMIDHKDQDKQNNDPENLRLATRSMNEQNTGVRKNNALGIKGVCKRRNGYDAQLKAGEETHRKWFPTLQEAIDHRKYLEEKFHPFAPSQQNVV